MKREGVRIIEADGAVTFENGVTGIRFDLKKRDMERRKVWRRTGSEGCICSRRCMEKQWGRHDLLLDDGGDFRPPRNRPDASH